MPPLGARSTAEVRTRLTYLMLFRVGVVTFLLVATFFSELGAPPDQPTEHANLLFALIAATYGFTIGFAVSLNRTPRIRTLATVQVATDLVLTTALVHLTGGVESGFAFMYLLIVVSASFVIEGSALFAAVAATVLYAGLIALRHVGLLPLVGQMVQAELPRDVFRSVAINAVAFVATGVLAARLAVELRRAGEHIETAGLRLRDLAALHADVIRCLTSGLLTVGRERLIVTFNAAAAEILGVPAADAVGRRADELVPALQPLFDAVADDSPLRRSELHHVTSDGQERILGVSLSPLVDSRGTVLGRVVSFQDLTELRRMEDAMARAERLAAIGRLAAGVAHEIRNPLAAISGSIELLAQSETPANPADQKELMEIVLREVERLNGLITQLLEFARPPRVDPQPLELAGEVAELVRVFEHDRQLGGARVELTAPEPVWIEADQAQLRQVVWNLVRNACEASREGAKVAIEIAAERERGWARLVVRDHGEGIPVEHRARIFEPFFSTKQGGTGLGLATVHRIVEEHKGSIELEAPAGGGTAFVVRLPLKDAPAATAEPAKAQSA